MSFNSDILNQLSPITLEEMDAVKLMNRTDTKFTFNLNLLEKILLECKNEYKILEINQIRTANYKTLYFDTFNHDLFLHHHNEKPYRYKIRIRNYTESKLFYLEIKQKIKGRTVKNRIKLSDFEIPLSEKSKTYIAKIINEEISLQPSLWNNFTRITLVNNNQKERLTIDYNLAFDFENKHKKVDDLVIAEVKQDNRNRSSKIIEVMRKYGIRESGISKYCYGSVLLNSSLKYNNFKSKILQIQKITKAA